MGGTGRKVSLPLHCGIDQSATVSSVFVCGWRARWRSRGLLAGVYSLIGKFMYNSNDHV
jgi:hypothetical protein